MTFKSSSSNSDFGIEFSQPAIKTVQVNYTRFPKGPCVGDEMATLYLVSKSKESYSEFVDNMLRLQYHVTAYLNSIDKLDYCLMKSALEFVPEYTQIQAHLHLGMSSSKVVNFYVPNMIIYKRVFL